MKKFTFLFALLLIAVSAKAQLTYQNGSLTFNGPRFVYPMDAAATTWHGTSHAWVYPVYSTIPGQPNGQGYLKFHFSPSGGGGVHIGSSNGVIAFMDSNPYPPLPPYMELLALAYYISSDFSTKSNIAPVSGATRTILSLKPVTYHWRDRAGSAKGVKRSPLAANPKEISFIAQDVEKVLPDIIAIDEFDSKLINYTALIPILTAAIQELNARIEVLEQQLKAK
ncbi:MAG: tail fiber domain-containing protein [Bacteroidales bacterium]|nr:tail fiber domain-containing protein [Bacteroidales bacterium]